ncbi:MAG: TOBE domain-containing protein [Alphaproteobacteria bacterium]|nr:TOBE domain-containing protein [Alphaproteobacteria bacterium]
MREPAVFLFDEPLSNLDAKLRVQMRLEIKRLQRELGTTSIYVTHDQVEAMTLADRLIVMNAGRAEQIGTPMDVYERPATTFVAGFIGSPAMNFLSGKVGADRRTIELATADNQHVTLPLGRAAEGEIGRVVTLGVRPEHLLADGGTGAIALQVDMVEPLGADTLLHGHFGESREGITVRMPGHVQIKGGEMRRFAVDAANVHLFDAESGARLALA